MEHCPAEMGRSDSCPWSSMSLKWGWECSDLGVVSEFSKGSPDNCSSFRLMLNLTCYFCVVMTSLADYAEGCLCPIKNGSNCGVKGSGQRNRSLLPPALLSPLGAADKGVSSQAPSHSSVWWAGLGLWERLIETHKCTGPRLLTKG